ncbi:hypothetical protein KUTeg_002676 [Tegillarca granosa]|uniref:Uncharacterized protein n=1 Tax=Tegillarca granosa TaxID=220873 RepID=A0ABQ9FV41_TEGGR|nr:hypothetical protein KUTeg_002676 [Tegillarca granosa]
MKDSLDKIINLSFLCLLLDLILYTYAADNYLEKNDCHPAILYSTKSYKKTLSISQNERDFKNILTNKCLYEIDMYTWKSGGLRINFTSNNDFKSSACSTFSSIDIKVDKIGKPVKTLSCNDAGIWTVPWPNKRVFVEIHLEKNSTQNHLNETARAILMLELVHRSSYIGYKKYKEYIDMVTFQYESGTPQYCLGDFYYKITFKKKYYGYRYTKRKIMFRLVEKSVCIQTDTTSRFGIFTDCPWKINLKIGDWYSNNFNSGVDYTSRKHTSSSAIYIPIIGVFVFVFALICGASYLRSKRHNPEYEERFSRRSQITYRSADSDDLPQNPAYRTHDPVRGPDYTPSRTGNNSYRDAPPDYPVVMASAPQQGHLSTTITSPSANIPTAPPPSYEEAIKMTNNNNRSDI